MHSLKEGLIATFQDNFHRLSERQELWNGTVKSKISEWIEDFIHYNVSQGNINADDFKSTSGGEHNFEYVGMLQAPQHLDISFNGEFCDLKGGFMNFQINARGNLTILMGRPYVKKLEHYEDGEEIAYLEEIDMRDWKEDQMIGYCNTFFEILNEYYDGGQLPNPIGFKLVH